MDHEIVVPGKEWHEKSDPFPLRVDDSPYTLTELANDYNFFTHGPFFTFAGASLHQDPVGDWLASMQEPVCVIKQPYRNPVFRGLTAPCGIDNLSWDHIVCAVAKPFWESLSNFVGGVFFQDKGKRTLYQACSADIEIRDPVTVEQHGQLHPDIPTVPITIFTVDSNYGRWEIKYPEHVNALPYFVKAAPSLQMQQLAQSLFAGDTAALAELLGSKKLPDIAPLRLPSAIPIESLSPERQQELRQAMTQMKETGMRIKATQRGR